MEETSLSKTALRHRLYSAAICTNHPLVKLLLHSHLPASQSSPLLRPNVLQLVGRVEEVVRVGLGRDLAALGLLHEVLIALLVGEVDGILLGLEVELGALHHVGGRLPAHERVLPSVALGEDVPVHAPVVALPVAGLRGGLGLLVDAVRELAFVRERCEIR